MTAAITPRLVSDEKSRGCVQVGISPSEMPSRVSARVREPSPGATVDFLREAARYFENRPTNGEDSAHWANHANAENCRKAADLIERAERALAVTIAERDGFYYALLRLTAAAHKPRNLDQWLALDRAKRVIGVDVGFALRAWDAAEAGSRTAGQAPGKDALASDLNQTSANRPEKPE